MASRRFEAVDLFCGVGGLTRGLEDAGIRVKAGFDIAGECKFAYESNTRAPFIEANIRKLKATDVNSLYSRNCIKVLAGCAPCPTFSSYTQGADKRRDRRWQLLDHMLDVCRGIQPDVVTMENVPQITKHFAFERFVDGLLNEGFDLWYSPVACSSYGVPQERHRLVLLASRIGHISLSRSCHKPRTVRSAIASLPPLRAGEAHPGDPLHRAAGLSDINLKRIRASKPNGTWHDWPRSLRSACHTQGNGVRYTAVYGRMAWDSPSPTITTQCFNYGSGRFGHPEQDRAISLREAAILQSFPRDYLFSPNNDTSLSALGRMIGNAVPVRLAQAIGNSILNAS